MRRFHLSKDERKKLLEVLDKEFKFSCNKNAQFEKIILDKNMEVYLIDQKACFFVKDGRVYPTLVGIKENLVKVPVVTVDMGAVPHVAGGADVMAPGIVSLEDFRKDDIVCVVDVNNKMPLLVGVALFSSEEIKMMKKGKVVTNVHHVGDVIWEVATH
ncbi:MAG: DUF1947 domain-containing protein [Candidatus Korarchaeota archaeon]